MDYRWTTEDVIDSIDQDNKFFTNFQPENRLMFQLINLIFHTQF